MKVELSEQLISTIKNWAKRYSGSADDRMNAVSHLSQIVGLVEEQEKVNQKDLENHIEDLVGGIS